MTPPISAFQSPLLSSHIKDSLIQPPQPSSPRPIPPQLHLSPPSTQAHTTSLRRINSLLLPIPYPTKFYSELLEPNAEPSACAVLAFWRGADEDEGQVVGGVRVRIEAPMPHVHSLPYPKDPEVERRIYISTLAVLSPWRGKGIGEGLLESVIREVERRVAKENVTVKVVYAHVWEGNPEALEWYLGRGFKKCELVQSYYRRLKPPGAWIIWRPVES
ncbi:MAG: hypothetical protein M1814_004628 [Vezdaea aestivalis]|nr:MAG: hypothetical protein M1814_004628 [Vezdaea aestivalis]